MWVCALLKNVYRVQTCSGTKVARSASTECPSYHRSQRGWSAAVRVLVIRLTTRRPIINVNREGMETCCWITCSRRGLLYDSTTEIQFGLDLQLLTVENQRTAGGVNLNRYFCAIAYISACWQGVVLFVTPPSTAHLNIGIWTFGFG